MNESEKRFDFRNLFQYMGFVGAGISALTYLIVIAIMINGFDKHIQSDKMIIFSLLGGAFGLVITIFLRTQGMEFAKRTPEAQAVLINFKKETKITRRSITYHLTKSIIFDIISKVGGVVISTMFVLNVFIEGMQDARYFYLAIANVLMFISFGFIGLVKTYDVYLEDHIPYLEQKIKDATLTSVSTLENDELEQARHRVSINDRTCEEIRGVDTQEET